MLVSPRKNGLTSLFKEVRVCKTFGGRKTYQTTHPLEKISDPSKRAYGVLSLGLLYRENRATTPEAVGFCVVRLQGRSVPKKLV